MERKSKKITPFLLVSWIITGIIVAVLIGLTLFWLGKPGTKSAAKADATTAVTIITPSAFLNGNLAEYSIVRQVTLNTIIPTRQPYDVIEYTVKRGDSLFGVAATYNIKPETLYWANFNVFNGSPDNIKPGDVLQIPPVDGVYYKWQEGDTLDSVAKQMKVDPETILNWPGNKLDLTNPVIPVGTFVMIPGAKKTDQPLFISIVTRNSSPGVKACGGGYVGRGYFNWPTINHYLSGYDYGDGGGSHKGIDIAASYGSPIYAADTGVVTMASMGEWNYGYGNVIQIDHGNGFVTLYAHLSNEFVERCQSVLAGGTIGAAGSTGNSSGTHLHFEIRFNGAAVNPWLYLP